MVIKTSFRRKCSTCVIIAKFMVVCTQHLHSGMRLENLEITKEYRQKIVRNMKNGFQETLTK